METFFVQVLSIILSTCNYRKYKKLSVVLMHKNKCHVHEQLITLYDKKKFPRLWISSKADK